MIKMEIVEGRELGKMFRQRGRRAKTAVDRILLQAASQVAREARRNVAKKTGRLKASIAHKLIRRRDGQTDAIVGTKTYYGTFLEFGTGQKGAESGAQSVGGMKVHKYGAGRGAKGGKKRNRDVIGMKARPWLGPAYRNNINRIQDKVESELARAVMEGEKGG